MRRTLVIAIIISSLSFAACSKGGTELHEVSPEQAKKNAEQEKTAPYAAPTVRGSIERIHLAVSSAIDAFHLHKNQEVLAYLNTARQETEKALSDAPQNRKYNVTREALEEMKGALDRTIQAANAGSQGVEAQLADLQTRVGALKAQYPATPGQ